jgi:hypothetical protein
VTHLTKPLCLLQILLILALCLSFGWAHASLEISGQPVEQPANARYEGAPSESPVAMPPR